MSETYVCPRCGQDGKITSIVPLLDNVRYDMVICDCGAVWRVYYKFENPKVEVVAMPVDTPKEEIVAEE